MTETTHEALLRQTATAEELLAYFQGQRVQFQADVADAIADAEAGLGQRQAAYDALAADLVGVVDDKLTKVIFVDAVNGDDANDGAVATPVRTIAGAAALTVPGGNYRLRLFGDQTHELNEAAAFHNSFVALDKYNGVARPKLVAKYNGGHPSIDYCIGITLVNSTLDINNVDLETELAARSAAHFSSGMFLCWGGGRVKTLYANVNLGDFPLVRVSYGHFCSLFFQHGAVDRNVNAYLSARLMEASTGAFSIASASVPSGEAWADYLPIVRDAAGVPINIVSNIAL